MITGKHLARRTFLRGIGAAISLPVLDAMTPAFAATTRLASNSPPRMALRRSSSKLGKRSGSGLKLSRLRSSSHCPAKFSTNATDLGSSSMRRTCASITSGLWSLRSPANRNSSWSGMLLQRKYERREASS